MNFKNGKVFTSNFVGTGPSSYEKIIYRAEVSQRLRNTDLHHPDASNSRRRQRLSALTGTWPTEQSNTDLGITFVSHEISRLAKTLGERFLRHSNDSITGIPLDNADTRTVQKQRLRNLFMSATGNVTTNNTDVGSDVAGCLLPSF